MSPPKFVDRTSFYSTAVLDGGSSQTTPLPLTRPGIVAGSVLVFIPSLGAYLAPDLLGGARTVYMGNLIQSQFTFVRDAPFGAALSFLLSLVVVLLLVVFRRPLGEARSA